MIPVCFPAIKTETNVIQFQTGEPERGCVMFHEGCWFLVSVICGIALYSGICDWVGNRNMSCMTFLPCIKYSVISKRVEKH